MNAKQKSALTKIFVISGTALLWAPILFMFITAVIGSVMSKTFLFDYLMLAEAFPIVALGLILLVLASLIARTFGKWFGWGSAAALFALVAVNIISAASGLASGALAPSGLIFGIVIASIVIYNVIIIALAVLGIVFIKKLFIKPAEAPAQQEAE